MSISKDDISGTFFHKYYSELVGKEKKKVDEIYESHLRLQEKASCLFDA